MVAKMVADWAVWMVCALDVLQVDDLVVSMVGLKAAWKVSLRVDWLAVLWAELMVVWKAWKTVCGLVSQWAAKLDCVLEWLLV